MVKIDMVVASSTNLISTNGKDGYSLQESVSNGVTETIKTLMKDGKAYYIDDAEKKYYCTGDAEEGMMDDFQVDALFADLTYVNTTIEEVNGVKYAVDNFKTKSGNQDAKFYLNAEGKIKLALISGMVVDFEINEGYDEAYFQFPAGYTEVNVGGDVEDMPVPPTDVDER
jgi:hypothetical protein